MNYAIKTPNLTRPVGYGRSLQVLTANDAERLEAFYLTLDFDSRRRRFGGGSSNQAITQYSRAIDWQRTIMMARGSSYILDAVLEIHPFSLRWDRAEIAMTCPLQCDRSRIFAELLQLAAFTAGARGCATFVMQLNAGCCEETDIFANLGRNQREGDILSVDISEYAAIAERRRG